MTALTQQELNQAVKTLALLVRRGFPIADGLRSLESSHPAWIKVRARVKEGDTVGQALKRYPHIFSEHFSSMVESAGQSLEGDSILTSLSQWLEVAEEVRRKVKEILHYPFLLLSFLFLEMALLIGIGLPSLILPYAFANQSVDLASYNAIITSISYVFFFLAALSLLGTFRTQWFLPLAMKVSSFRSTLLRADQALWSRALGSHLQGGQTLPEALKSCSDIVWSKDLQKELATLPERIEKGDLFSQALSQCDLIDPHLRWSVTAGESKEDLSGTLLYAAEQLESHLLTQCRAFLLFLQPCAVGLIGLMTAALLGSFWWSFYHYSWNMTL